MADRQRSTAAKAEAKKPRTQRSVESEAEKGSQPLPVRHDPDALFALQRTAGNRAVNRLLGPRPPALSIQARLTVGAAHDPYEQEAERVAAQVTGQLSTPVTQGPASQAPASAPHPETPSAEIKAGSPDTLQRLILIPFNNATDDLRGFATNHATALAPGPVVMSANGQQMEQTDEDIVIVAHGNGTQLFNKETHTTNGPEFAQLEISKLAEVLKAMLPENYTGTITIWACQSARPWRHIEATKEQLEDEYDDDEETREALLDSSFIKQLELHLKEDFPNATIKGSIGFLTIDRPVDRAQVYANENDLMFGNTKDLSEGGLITSKQKAPDDFYKDYDEDDDDDFEINTGKNLKQDDDSDSNGSSDEFKEDDENIDMEMDTRQVTQQTHTTAPQFRSKQEYLDAIMKNAPFGSTTQTLSLRQRLEKQKKEKKNKTFF